MKKHIIIRDLKDDFFKNYSTFLTYLRYHLRDSAEPDIELEKSVELLKDMDEKIRKIDKLIEEYVEIEEKNI